jgi:hypothetical protein
MLDRDECAPFAGSLIEEKSRIIGHIENRRVVS